MRIQPSYNQQFTDPYSFQAQEHDDELKGDGNSLSYKYRMHDPRLGRFFAVDPLICQYPYYSSYQFSGNRPIDMIELEGLEPTPVIPGVDKGIKQGSTKSIGNWASSVTLFYHNGGKYSTPGYYTASDYNFLTKLKQEDRELKQKAWAVLNPIDAQIVGEGKWDELVTTSTSASVFSTNAKFDGKTESGKDLNKENAFRHACWMAFTTYALGNATANEVGNAHEEMPNIYLVLEDNDIWKLSFKYDENADAYADGVNNHYGRKLGTSWEKGMTRKEQALKVLDYFHTDGLIIGGDNPDKPGETKVWTYKLSDEEFNTIRERILECNDWGFNKKDKERYEKTTNKK